MVFNFAKNDSDWSKKVLAKTEGCCVICSSEATPAHVFRRGDLNTRLVIENGVPLCVQCHNWFDGLSVSIREKAAKILIGDVLYFQLKELNKNGE